jgi:adenylate cyclase class 2
MPIELEAKIRIADRAAIEQRLRQLGAHFECRQLEVNTFLDTAARELRRADSGLRVRQARDLESRQTRTIITHKGPRQPGCYKSRSESELVVESYEDALALLRQLGFDVTLTFEKRRQTWQLGGCEVVLDELPRLGEFLEVEGPSEEAIAAVLKMLGLAGEPLIAQGYATLIAELLEPTGRRELRFESQ